MNISRLHICQNHMVNLLDQTNCINVSQTSMINMRKGRRQTTRQGYELTANLRRRHDLPTPESPMSKSLNRQSLHMTSWNSYGFSECQFGFKTCDCTRKNNTIMRRHEINELNPTCSLSRLKHANFNKADQASQPSPTLINKQITRCHGKESSKLLSDIIDS